MFNEKWIYYPKDKLDDKKTINLPHDAMFYEKRTIESKGGKNLAWFLGKDYIYEKDFIVTDEMLTKNIYLEFDGIYKNATIFLNEQKIYYRPNGYINFILDLTKHLIKGSNNLKVEVINSDQPNSRWYTGAGIYRPVKLHILPVKQIEVNSIKIKTIDYKSGIINLKFKVTHEGPCNIKILDKNNSILLDKDYTIKEIFDENFIIKEALLWSGENPNLYKVQIDYFSHIYEETFGIREVKVNSKEGLLINGKKIILRGACIHHDNGMLGAVGHPFSEKRKIKILKNNGYNAIRSAHNPTSKAILKACDELGMYVIDEYTDMWYINKTPYDYANYFMDWWKKDLNDMVNKNYNHPSVIMYSIGNEVAETSQTKGIKLTEDMSNHLKSMDDRPITCGINLFFNYLYSLGFGVYSNKKAEKYLKNPNKSKSVGSEFFNDLAGKLGDTTMKIGAWLGGSDRKTKDAFSKLDVSGYNYGIYRYKKDLKKYPDRVILGTETFAKDARRFWELANQNNALIGDFVWAGFDYLGEVSIGSWVYGDHAKTFTHGPGWITSGTGRIDINGIPNSEMNYTRVAYELEDIKMGVIPVNNYLKKHSPSAWKLSNALESWSFEGYENKKTKVEVYSLAYKVGLYINDKKIKIKKAKRSGLTKFKVRYKSGTVKAVGYNKEGNKIHETILETAGLENKISITPEQKHVKSNELLYVQINITDNNGIIKPMERDKLKIAVENGQILAFGNSCPYNDEGYHNNYSETYFGESMAIIKPISKGEIKIKINSKYGEYQSFVSAD